MFKKIAGFLNRSVFLYLSALVLIVVFADLERAREHAVNCALSRYIPDHEYLIAFDKQRHNPDKKVLGEFERYYAKVAQFMPDIAEAKAMRGFVSFYAQHADRARKYYEAAVRADPDVFNFHYNLGLLALQRRDHPSAITHLQNAIAVDPIQDMHFVVNSRVYKPFLPYAKDPDSLAYAMGMNSRRNYEQAYLCLLASYDATQNFSEMLLLAQKALKRGFPRKEIFYFYAGKAAYELKSYDLAVQYLQQALTAGFQYSQAYEMMGLCLQKLNRKESPGALFAAASLARAGQSFDPETLSKELVIF